MENCAVFINGQNAAFEVDLDERMKKISIVTDIVNLGTATRVTNFKAQATRDMGLMATAVSNLEGLERHTAELRGITRDVADIKRIDDTEAAATAYSALMKEYINTENAMVDLGKTMNKNADAYMQNCNAFLAGQNQKMLQEFKQAGANLEERLQKITLVNDIIDAGNAARVGNYKAQADQNSIIMQETIKDFVAVGDIFKDLRDITRENVDLDRIALVEKGGDGYKAAMEAYLGNYLSLIDLRGRMDIAAGAYVNQCGEFLVGQQNNLKSDMHERHEKITLINDVIDLR